MYQVQHSATLDCSEGEALTDFIMPWSNRESPITSFRAVWNDDWLGFQFQVVDEDIVLFEGEDGDDSVLGSDRVELFFATDHELKGYYYGIEMDPRGWVFDFRARYYREINDRWNFPSLKISAIHGDGGTNTTSFGARRPWGRSNGSAGHSDYTQMARHAIVASPPLFIA